MSNLRENLVGTLRRQGFNKLQPCLTGSPILPVTKQLHMPGQGWMS